MNKNVLATSEVIKQALEVLEQEGILVRFWICIDPYDNEHCYADLVTIAKETPRHTLFVVTTREGEQPPVPYRAPRHSYLRSPGGDLWVDLYSHMHQWERLARNDFSIRFWFEPRLVVVAFSDQRTLAQFDLTAERQPLAFGYATAFEERLANYAETLRRTAKDVPTDENRYLLEDFLNVQTRYAALVATWRASYVRQLSGESVA